MKAGVEALSEREKETLRLLLRGHDAKSIARELDLSVHTVNERLRDTRRKLGVSSSREAARLLADAEHTPERFGDKDIGVADTGSGLLSKGVSDRSPGGVKTSTWLIGGIVAMSLIIAAALLSGLNASESRTPVEAAAAAAAAASTKTPQSPATAAALSWVVLVDAGKLEESWNEAGTLFRSQVGAAGWSASVKPVREQVGDLVTRNLKSATKHKTLPGAPAGDYEIVEFSTSFSKAKSTVETVVLAREASGWKVVGYFVRPA